MALRFIYIGLALTMLISSGCRRTANYQPACPPAVVSSAPACPNPAPPLPPPPPPPVPFR